MKREQANNTEVCKGWVCPHARVRDEAQLICVLGRSPTGIDYGAPDGKPVSLVAMHVVPENQANYDPRVISLLANALVGRVLCRDSVAYSSGRVAYDCIAVSLIPNNSRQKKTSKGHEGAEPSHH